MSSFDYITGAETKADTDKAASTGEWDKYYSGMQLQREQALAASMQVTMEGGDPLRETRPIGANIDASIELDRRLYHMGQEAAKKRQILKDSGWDQVRTFLDGVGQKWKASKEAHKVKNPESVEDKMEWMKQLMPIVEDANEVANIRQIAVQADQALKAAFGPDASVWTDPQTKNYAQWLNREAGQGGVFESGPQRGYVGWDSLQVNPISHFVGMSVAETVGAASDFGLNLVHGAWDVTDQAVRALGGSGISSAAPTNYLMTPDGGMVHNGGKVPDFMDSLAMLWAHSTNQNVEKYVADLGEARELDRASRNWFEAISHGTSRIAGMGLGFGLPAGMAMNAGARAFGTLTTKGLHALRVADTTRKFKIMQVMGGTVGAGAGLGSLEGVAFGRQESYMGSFLNGMAMAPVLMSLGLLGKRIEKLAVERMKAPQFLGEALGSAMEGVGFGAMQAGHLPFLPSAWDFIKDPNQSNWEIYAQNIFGFMLFKAATRRSVSPGEEGVAGAALQIQRGRARAEFAEKFSRGEITEAQAREQGLDPATLIKVGEASRQAREAKTPEEAAKATERRRQAEAEADIEEFGLGEKVELEMRKAESEDLAGRPEPETPDVKRLRELLERPPNDQSNMELAFFADEAANRGKVPKELQQKIDERLHQPQQTIEEGRRLIEETLRREAKGELASKASTKAPVEGVRPEWTPEKGVTQADIIAEMEGRPGKKGFRIPFTSKRLGGKPGDAVRVPIRKGRISKGAEGVFKIFENLIRSEDGRDLVVNAHEWSHAMHRKSLGEGGEGMIRRAGEQLQQAIKFDPAIKGEIREILKDYEGAESLSAPRQWMEAWSQWHSRNLLGEAGLDAKMPALGRFMRQWLAAPEQAALRPQYQRLQGMLWKFNYGMGASDLVGSGIVHSMDPRSVTQKATQPSRLAQVRDKLIRDFFDDIVALKRSQVKWLEAIGKKPEDLSILDDPSRLLDTTRMTANKTVEYYVKRGIRTPQGKIPGLVETLKDIGQRGFEFEKFLSAQKNIELHRAGKKTQFPIQTYLEARREILRENRDFVDKARKFKAWTDALVDYLARSGGLSADDAKRIKDAYVVYVPFFRAMEAQGRQGGGQMGGSPIRGIKGSAREIRDPLAAIVDVANQMVAKAHQNIVLSGLYKFAAGQEAGGVATVIPRDRVPKEHGVKEVLEALERQVELKGDEQHPFEDIITALRDSEALNEQTITLFTQKSAPPANENIMAFTPRLTEAEINSIARDPMHRKLIESQQGKTQWIEVDRPVYEALMGIDKIPTWKWFDDRPVMKALVMGPAGLIRLGATGLSPGFTIANIARDMLSQPMFNAEGKIRPFGGVWKWMHGAALYMHKGGEWRELYDELGVRTSSFFREGQVRNLMGQHRGVMQKTKHFFTEVLDKTQDFFAAPENFLRIREFKDTYEAAKAANKSEMEARLLALEAGREITVNFARGGVLARAYNQMTPYFNASLQGQRKLWRQIAMGGDAKGDVAKARVQRAAMMNGMLNITSISMLSWWLGHDKEWYQDLPEWRKIHYFNFKFGDQIVSLPKPFEAGILFGTIPEMLMDLAFAEGGRPPSPGAIAKNLFLGYLDGPAALIPAFAKPSIELQANRNFFTGRPLTPDWVSKSRVPAEQMTAYTTEVSKWTAGVLSEAIGGAVTPIQVEHFLGGHTAGMTTAAFRAMDELMGMRDHPGMAMNPLTRFTRQTAHGQGRFVENLYPLAKSLGQKVDSDLASPQEQALSRKAERAKRQISALRKSFKQGRITREERDRRSYEIARPIIEESEK